MNHRTFVRIWRWAQSVREVALTFGITDDEALARARRIREQGLPLRDLPEGPARWFVERFAEDGHTERFLDAWTRPYMTPAVLGLSPATAAAIAVWLRMLDVPLLAPPRMPFVN